MDKAKKALLHMIVFVLLFAGVCHPIEVHAETKDAELITIEEEKDLVVMFSYDKEIVDIVFISPDGVRYVDSDKDVETSSGELWKTYRIKNAVAGTWKVEYDLKSNVEIQYSIIEDSVGLWLQYLNVIEQTEDTITLSFLAENAKNDGYYNYVISAIQSNSDGNQEIASGSAGSGQEETVKVSLSNLTSGEYKFQVQVYYNDGVGELFDSLMTDAIPYVNPNTPKKLENMKIAVDSSNLNCMMDWKLISAWSHEEYKIKVLADDVIIFDSVVDSKTTSMNVTYPKTTSVLEMFLYYKTDSIWSEPLNKKVELGNEYLNILGDEITSNGQISLEYSTLDEVHLLVTLNDDSGEYIVSDTGTVTFDLVEGFNNVNAFFENKDGIVYLVDKDIYYDAYPPVISLYDDVNGKHVSTGTIDIIGAVDGAQKLLINESEYTIEENGNFCISVDLQQGENVIVIEAIDANGNSSMMSLTIYRGLTSEGKIASFAYLLVSFIVGIVLAGIGFFASKSKTKKENGKERNHRPLYIIFMFVDIALIVAWFILYNYTTSVDFLDYAEKSIDGAIGLMAMYRIIMYSAIAATIVLALWVIIKKAIFKKEEGPKKEKEQIEKMENELEEGYKFCTQCGKKIKITARFCTGCGHTLNVQQPGESEENREQ